MAMFITFLVRVHFRWRSRCSSCGTSTGSLLIERFEVWVLLASVVGELLMAVMDPFGVPASDSPSLNSQSVGISCPPRLHDLKHSKTFFQDMNKKTTKDYVLRGVFFWFFWGGYTEFVAFVQTLYTDCQIHIKSTHMSLVQLKKYVAYNNFALYTLRSRKEYNRLHYFSLLFRISLLSLQYSFHHSQKYYLVNNIFEWKNTLTAREHGMGELLDQGISFFLVLVYTPRAVVIDNNLPI